MRFLLCGPLQAPSMGLRLSLRRARTASAAGGRYRKSPARRQGCASRREPCVRGNTCLTEPMQAREGGQLRELLERDHIRPAASTQQQRPMLVKNESEAESRIAHVRTLVREDIPFGGALVGEEYSGILEIAGSALLPHLRIMPSPPLRHRRLLAGLVLVLPRLAFGHGHLPHLPDL